MKRVKAACVCQTLRFSLQEEMDYASAIKLVREEVAHYRKNMDRSGTLYRILEESEQPDGSILVKVIKQYNACPVGEYLRQYRIIRQGSSARDFVPVLPF